MIEFLQMAAMNCALVWVLMLLVWVLSLAINDSSIADIFWGLGFVIIVGFTWMLSDGVAARRTLVATLATLWGLGLRTYLSRRFLLRAEYKSYVVFTSRDDNEEVDEWKAGFTFFF